MIIECPGCKSRYDVTGRPPGTQARCRCGTSFALPEPSRSAAQLRCPQCGAGVAPGGHACEHCQAALLVKACPRCFGRMFHGSAHCQHCGAAVEVPAAADDAGDATPRACPRCRDRGVELEARLVGGFLLDECNACHGVYVDAATLERILAARRDIDTGRALGAPGAGGASTASAPPPDEAAGVTYLRCPDCDTLMNRQNFARVSGIILDVCKGHGTWFDAAELPRVIAFARAGGLERAERRDIDREREAARRAKADAAAQRAQLQHAGDPRGDSSASSLLSVLDDIADLLFW